MEVAEDELSMIVWEGWLRKKTARGPMRVWQNRYFRLLGDILEYYKSDKLGVCSGMIPLQMMTSIKLHPRSKKGGCRFDVLVSGGAARSGSGGSGSGGNEGHAHGHGHGHGGGERVFSLLAPTPALCAKLVRSLSNMIQADGADGGEEGARMDLSHIDMSGAFWKRIDDIEMERRRAGGAANKTSLAAQFAGFNLKRTARRRKPDASAEADALAAEAARSKSSASAAADPAASGYTTLARRERELLDAKMEEIEMPPLRILAELPVSLPLGKLFLVRDTESKEPFLMHAVDRAPNAASAAASASAAAAAAAAVDDGEDFSASKGWSDGSGGHTAATVRALWGDTARMPPHPFLVQMIPRSGSGSGAACSSAAGAAGVAGECADRVWTLYSYPHHSSLAVHVASLLVEQRDSLLLAQSFAAEDELPQPVPPPAMLLPAEVLRFLSAELLLLLSFLHGRGLVARGLALAQVYLSSQGHVQLLDPFLCETVEAAAARRRDDAYTTPEWHRTGSEDYRSDYWRLGLAMYELMTGCLPPGLTRLQQQAGPRSSLSGTQGGEEKEEKGASPSESGTVGGSGSSAAAGPDPAQRARQLKEGIMSFDSSDPAHLPFPLAATPALRAFVSSLLRTQPSQRLGGSPPGSSQGATPAETKAASHAELRGADWFDEEGGVEWGMLERLVARAAENPGASASSDGGDGSGAAPALPPVAAPECVHRSLLYASHNHHHARSTVLSSARAPPHRVEVVVKSGRNFRRATLVTPAAHMGGNQVSFSTTGAGGGGVGAQGPASPPAAAVAAADQFKLYVKVLVDGKALKTPVVDPSSSGLATASAERAPRVWVWPERVMRFEAAGALLQGEGGDLTARVLARDEDSFHDASIGSVVLPLRHVHQLCLAQVQAQAQAQALAADSSAAPASSSSCSPAVDSWFSVLGRDGFVVGELLLSLRVVPSDPAGANQSLTPLLTSTSRRRFSALFGARWSSDSPADGGAAGPSAASIAEMMRPQLVTRSGAEASPADLADPSRREILIPRRMLATVQARAGSVGGDGAAASVTASSAGSSSTSKPMLARPSIALLQTQASARSMLAAQPAVGGAMLPVDEDDGEDDDDDDDEKSPAAISPALSNAAAGSAALRGSVTTAATGRKMGPSSSSSPSAAGSGPGLSSPTSSNASAASAAAPAAAGAGTGTGATGGAKGFLRGLVSKKKFRFQEQGFDLDLSYVGDRIIAMGFPSEGSEAAYRNPLPEVQAFFHKFHPGAFRVYNLCSERRYDASKFGPECGGGPGCVVETPFDDHNAPKFHQILDLCVDAATFLSGSAERVVAIHCKAGKGRTGLMISCLLLYLGACLHPDAALSYYARCRTSNEQGVTIPSQRRYVHYFHQYLVGWHDRGLGPSFPWSGSPLLLAHVRLTGIPRLDMVSGGCDPSILIFQQDRCVFDSAQWALQSRGGGLGSRSGGAHQISATESGDGVSGAFGFGGGSDTGRDGSSPLDQVDWKVFQWLRGDFKLLLVDRDRFGRRESVAWFWLHTTFLARENARVATVPKREIDKALKDKECKTFPAHFKMQLFFHTPDRPFDEEEEEGDARGQAPRQDGREVLDGLLRVDVGGAAADGDHDNPHGAAASRRMGALQPWQMPAAAAAADLCRSVAEEDYYQWQAEVEEAAVTFQPAAMT